jgi:hypothetical protein
MAAEDSPHTQLAIIWRFPHYPNLVTANVTMPTPPKLV